MKCILIYNPNSGKDRSKELNYIISRLKEKYDIVDLAMTSNDENALLNEYKILDYDNIIIMGGDGTFNNIVSIISKYDKRPILGYIPSGTANDNAKNFGISKNYKKAIDIILNGKSIKHDVGMINDQYFVYAVATGNYANVSYKAKQRIKRILGRIAYIIEGLKQIHKIVKVEGKLIIDGNEIPFSCPLILVMNSISIGGFPCNKKRGHLNDGTFDVIIVKKYFSALSAVTRFLFFGIGKKDHTIYYDLYRAKEIQICVSSEVCWTKDGELGPSGNIKITNLPSHIEVIVNNKKTRHFLEKRG